MYCFARKGILGTNRMKRSFGSMEKFMNFTQSKRSRKPFDSSVFVASSEPEGAEPGTPFFHGLENQTIIKFYIFKAKELYIPRCGRAPPERTTKELVSTHKNVIPTDSQIK